MVVDQDIVDHNNRVVITAGAEVNPLDLVSLRSPLLFFNGDSFADAQKTLKIAAHEVWTCRTIPRTKCFDKLYYFESFGGFFRR